MELFPETLDPSESKEYTFDWSPKLGSGETIVSHVVTFIDAAGTTASNSVATPYSKVRLSGGTHGGRATFSIVATTSAGNILDVALGVDVFDNATATEPSIQRTREAIAAELELYRVARTALVTGERVEDVWRDGRRMRLSSLSLNEINAAIADLTREFSQAAAVEAGTSRRRPINLAWSN